MAFDGGSKVARAGWCADCGANVWLTPEGACPQGHGPASITGAYDVPEQETPPAVGSVAAPAAPAQPRARSSKRGVVLVVLGVVVALLACCAVGALVVLPLIRGDAGGTSDAGKGATEESSQEAESAVASGRTGPGTAEELAAYLEANYGSESWYSAIAEVRYVTRLGYPVCQVVIADGGDRSFDAQRQSDFAIIAAIESADITFANNYETIGVKGTRASSNEEPWPGLERPKPLADIPAPANLDALKSWLEAQYGPQGANPVSEGWYEVFKTAQWSVEGDRIKVRTSLTRDPDGGLAEEDLMYAVAQARPTFATGLEIYYADGQSDVDGTTYEIPWK